MERHRGPEKAAFWTKNFLNFYHAVNNSRETTVLVHLAVLITRTAPLILAAISLMFGTFATHGLYVANGWLAVPTGPELVGVTIGLLLLTYVVWGTLRRKLEA